MKYIDYQEVISAGANPDELKAYLDANPDIELINYKQPETPSPAPTPGMSTNQNMSQAPDIVDLYPDRSNVQQTEGPSYDHPGAIDEGPVNLESPVSVTNPIGGVPFSGTTADPSGQYYAGFGNYSGTIGASPEELAQMTPEEKARMSSTASEILNANPDNTQANEMLAAAFPGKNVNFTGHLANPILSDPQGIATGSAQLKVGSTGRSSGPHSHNQGIDVNGQPMDYQTAMAIIRSRQYR